MQMVQEIDIDSTLTMASWFIRVETPNGVTYSSVMTLPELREYKNKHPEVKNEDTNGVIPKYVLPIALHKNRAFEIKSVYIRRVKYAEEHS